MAVLTAEDKRELLRLARSVISARLANDPEKTARPKTLSPAMKEKRGCFVTLHKHGELRGCIGMIEPVRPLIDGVEENALNSAFRDPRFPPLAKDELPMVDIEISVLTVPEVLRYSDSEDLKNKLQPGFHGVILSREWNHATFLPQVWHQLPDTEMFLEHLCRKGGMKKDCWKDKETIIKTYKAEYFSEKEFSS